MDKFTRANPLLGILCRISVLAMLTGCTLITGVADTKPAEQTVTQVIPITGDEFPTSIPEADTPDPVTSIEEQQLEIDLTAFTNTLWVDADNGNDANSGQKSNQALKTIQRAADLAVPGTIIRILPGIYRESIIPASSGTPDQPILYTAENGLGSVKIRGSELASTLTWTQLTTNTIGLPAGVDPHNIYYSDLSEWALEGAPRYLVLADGITGDISTQLMPAREPDWEAVTDFKYSEYWWLANGGLAVAGCDPTTNANNDCDLPWRSFTQLTDTLTDTVPEGIEAGNLKSLPNLTGATVVMLDAQHAHYIFRRTIIAHDRNAGKITVDEECNNDGKPGLGWGSKYYLENHPSLIDHPGEWWYDKVNRRLYFWESGNELDSNQKLEISRRTTGFDLSNRSYIYLSGLQIDLYNGTAYQIDNTGRFDIAHGNIIQNSRLLYANKGIVLHAYVSEIGSQYAIDGFLLENSEVGFMDAAAIDSTYWWEGAPTASQFTHSGIRNLTILNNIFHHLGFGSLERSAVGIRIFFPDKVRFEANHMHHVAQNGMHIHQSLINSGSYYNINPQSILIGDILIKDNLFEETCLAASDCGGLKIGGNRPDTHVYRDFLISGNIFRNNFGWSYVSILRKLNDLGDGNGFYLDYASGVHLYRNIAYNNTGAGFKVSCLWRDGDAVFVNNIAANNYLYGFKFTGTSYCDDHNGSVNTQLVNNIIMNNGLYGIQFVSAYENQYGNLTIDHNLYFQNGWNNPYRPNNAYFQLFRASLPAQYFLSLNEIRQMTAWEDHGEEGNPFLLDYDASDNSTYTYFWPDFRPTVKSAHLIDQGTAQLPTTLNSLLLKFQVPDVVCGRAYDIGRFEFTDPLYEGSICFEFKNIYLPIIRR